jgi:hypothetical protein
VTSVQCVACDTNCAFNPRIEYKFEKYPPKQGATCSPSVVHAEQRLECSSKAADKFGVRLRFGDWKFEGGGKG